jgi:TatA/E family protein of Tat protein translocase
MVLYANLSPVDLTVVFVVALLVFGPKKLPEVGKQVGTALRDLRKLSNEFVGVMTGVRDDATSLGQTVRGVFNDPDPASSNIQPIAPVDQPEPASLTSGLRRRGLSLSALPPEPPDAEEKAK